MNTTLSNKSLLDITVLREPPNIKVPWTVVLEEHWGGFLEAIDALTSVNTTSNDEGQNIGLSDVAYVLNNVGSIWSKQVDDVAKIVQRTMELLNELEATKITGKGKTAGAKVVFHRRTVHPLALPADDTRTSGIFFTKLGDTKIPAHKWTVTTIPSISLDRYLPPYMPNTLPLLEIEKIHPYFDDRGNKGHDWAEFLINVLKLNKEGYYPLEHGGPACHIPLAKRRYTFSVMPEMSFGGDRGDEGNGLNAEGSVEVYGGFDAPSDPAIAESVPASLNASEHNFAVPAIPALRLQRRDAGWADIDMLCVKDLSINLLREEKGLNTIPEIKDCPNVETPFRRRCKRKVVPKELCPFSGEVEFFKYFWDIQDARVDLDFVLKRFGTRLRQVEVVIPQKGRGRKPKKTVQFVSLTNHQLPQPPFGESPEEEATIALRESHRSGEVQDAEKVEDYAMDTLIDEVADYVDTDVPCGSPHAFELDADADMFAEMRKQGVFNRLNYTLMEHGAHTTQYFENLDEVGADSSLCLVFDLNDWEGRLENFLRQHEDTTAGFNLEQCGDGLVATYRSKTAKKGVPLVDVIGKKSIGDVSRSFLSILDLVNKNKITLDMSEGKTEDGSRDEDFCSLDIGRFGMRVSKRKDKAVA